MNRCILHVGLPKTGTTTIERFLRQDLSDPAFLHCELGDVGTGRALAALFGDPSDLSMKNATMGWSDRPWSDYRLRMEEEWAQSLRTAAQRQATWVISAEFCWFMSPAGLGRLQR